MSAVYGISVDAATEIINQLADEMVSMCQSFEEAAKVFEQELAVEVHRLELKKQVLEMMGYEDIVIEQENTEPPHHREKLLPYNKRRKFVNKPYWNRIRSRCW